MCVFLIRSRTHERTREIARQLSAIRRTCAQTICEILIKPTRKLCDMFGYWSDSHCTSANCSLTYAHTDADVCVNYAAGNPVWRCQNIIARKTIPNVNALFSALDLASLAASYVACVCRCAHAFCSRTHTHPRGGMTKNGRYNARLHQKNT